MDQTQIFIAFLSAVFVVVQSLIAYIANQMNARMSKLSDGVDRLSTDIHRLAITTTEHRADLSHIKEDIVELKSQIRTRPCLNHQDCDR